MGGFLDNMNNLLTPSYVLLPLIVTTLSAAIATALGVKINTSEVKIILSLLK